MHRDRGASPRSDPPGCGWVRRHGAPADLPGQTREAADAFAAARRADQAAAERAEDGVLAGYLPAQLSDVELAAIVTEVIKETGASGMAAMGQV